MLISITHYKCIPYEVINDEDNPLFTIIININLFRVEKQRKI